MPFVTGPGYLGSLALTSGVGGDTHHRSLGEHGEAQHFGAGGSKDTVPAGVRDIICISKETTSSLAEDSRLVGDCGIPLELSL